MEKLNILEQREIMGKTFTIYGTGESPLFLAKEVAGWIEHTNPRVMLQTVDVNEKVVNNIYTPGGEQKCWFLTEDGLYEVLMQSRKPIAKQFKKKVKEILKEIRKTGSYQIQPKQQQTPTCIEDLIIQQATILKELRLKVDSQQQQIDQLKHKPFSQLKTYRSCEAWLRMKKIPYQKTFFWAFSRRCAKYSHKHNIPVQRTRKNGYSVNAYREDVLEICFGHNVLPAPKQPQKVKKLVYAMAQFFNSWEPDERLIAIENFQEFFVQAPIKYRDAIWQALTTDISKIPEYIEIRAVRNAS